MTMDRRERLIALRPEATTFAQCIRSLPASIVGMEGMLGNAMQFPFKSVRGYSLHKLLIGHDGLQSEDGKVGNRRVMFAKRVQGEVSGRAYSRLRFSLREESRMLQISTDYAKEQLVLSVAGKNFKQSYYMSPEQLQPQDGERVMVRMSMQSDEVRPAILLRHGLTEWMQVALGIIGYKGDPEEIEALYFPPDVVRPVEAQHACGADMQTLFTDGGYAHFVNERTHLMIEDCRRAKHGPDCRKIALETYRADMVMHWLPACAEYLIKTIEIDADGRPVRVRFGGEMIRCASMLGHYPTGERHDGDPLKSWQEHLPPRENAPNSVTFGHNVTFEPQDVGVVIAGGMTFRVIEEKE
jgi:hypothetical protein